MKFTLPNGVEHDTYKLDWKWHDYSDYRWAIQPTYMEAPPFGIYLGDFNVTEYLTPSQMRSVPNADVAAINEWFHVQNKLAKGESPYIPEEIDFDISAGADSMQFLIESAMDTAYTLQHRQDVLKNESTQFLTELGDSTKTFAQKHELSKKFKMLVDSTNPGFWIQKGVDALEDAALGFGLKLAALYIILRMFR